MRPPSRRIPPRTTPRRANRFVLWCMAVATLLCIHWLFSASVAFMVVCGGLFMYWFGQREAAKRRRLLMQLACAREREAICEFAQYFDPRSVDTWVIRAVYDTLQHELEDAYPAFPVRASDRLKTLLFDSDDLDMSVVPEVARRAQRTLNNSAENPYYGRVHTVSDLVLFFNSQGKASVTPTPLQVI